MAALLAQGADIQRQIMALRCRYAAVRLARVSLIPSWGIA